jgi:hypothetical protein
VPSVSVAAHARSGDAEMISGYLGSKSSFVKAVAKFALAYAEQKSAIIERCSKPSVTAELRP